MKVASLEIELFASIARLQRDMDQAKQTVDRAMGGIEKSVERAKIALGSLGAGFGIREIINLTDEYTKFTAQLKLATNSATEYARASADVRRIAKDAQGDLAGTGVLYARIANGTRELGVSQARVADITETVNLALKVSGATAQESASAQLQLSQAFASGTLRGEEFNAVNEAAPRLMKALADGIGVPVGALREMATEGKITSEVMASALPRALQDLRKEAESVQTISGAFTVLKNNVMEFVGTQAQASGAVSVITSGIGLLAENLQLLVSMATGLAAVKLSQWAASAVTEIYKKSAALSASVAAIQAERAATIAATGAEVVRLESTLAFITADRARTVAQMQSAQATMAATAAMGAYSAALHANTAATAANSTAISTLAALGKAQATVATQLTAAQAAHSAALASTGAAAGLASRALGLLGGPIGAITTLLGIGVTAWMAWGSASESQEKRAAESIDKSTAEIMGDLDRQIAKLKERNALAASGIAGAAQSDSEAMTRMARLRAQMDAAEKGTGEFTGINETARTDILRKLGLQYGELFAKIQQVNAEQTKLDASGKAATDLIEVRQRLLGVNKQYLEDLSKLEAAREKGSIDEREYIALVSQLATETYKKSEAGKEFTKGFKEGNKELEDQAKLLADLSGVNADYMEQLSRLHGMRVKQNMSDERYIELVQKLIALQPGAKKQMEEMEKAAKDLAAARADLRKKEEDAIEDYFRAQTEGYNAAVKGSQDALKAAQEEYVQFGMSKSQIVEITLLKLESAKASFLEGSEGYNALQKQIDAQKDLIEVLQKTEAAQGWKSIFGSIDRTAHDTFVSIFDSGKSAFDRLRDTLKNGLLDLLYQMTVKKWIFSIGATVSGVPGIANAGGTTGSLMQGMDLLSMGQTLWNGFSGGMASSMGGVVSSMGSLFGSSAISAFGTGMGMTSAGVAGATGAAAIEAGVGVTGSAASAMSAGSAFGTAVPWIAGAAALYSIIKGLDDSGTIHTGGAARADSAGVSTIDARALGFMRIDTSSGTEKMVSSLATSVVNILENTATAFGKTAGYSAATAFADDTSKDGAWGALLIEKMGTALVNWDSNRQSRWAPREFADGEAGRNQYLAALSASVRTALNDIGLPGWAQSMLDALGDAPAITDLAAVVDKINATQRALVEMGNTIVGFANMSDQAVSALINAAGGFDALAGAASTYYDNFYSEEEKLANTTKQITEALAAVGVAMPTTREEYRRQVEAQMALGEAGAQAVATLLQVSGAFANVTDAAAATAVAVDSMPDLEELRDRAMQEVDAAFTSLQRAVDAQRDAITKSHQAAMAAINASIGAANASISKLTSLSNSLRSTVDRMRLPAEFGTDRAAAQAQISTALAIARAGSVLPDADSLSNALNVVSQPSEQLYSTFLDYQRDFLITRNNITALADLTDSQLSIEQRTLQALEDQLKVAERGYDAEMARLDGILAYAQQQIDWLSGIKTEVMSLSAAMQAFAAARTAAAPVVSVVPPSTGGGVGGGGYESVVQGLYQSILGRTGEAAGVENWVTALQAGMSYEEARQGFLNSTEYQAMANVPKLDIGTNYVPRDMLAMIHEGEAVVPKAYNPAAGGHSSGAGNAELVAEVRALKDVTARQQDALDKIEKASRKTTEILDRVTRGGVTVFTEEE